MGRAPVYLLVVIVLVLAGVAVWWIAHPANRQRELVLYGNVDLREVDLAFNNSERISQVLVEEGDHVHPGQVLARVETTRLVPETAQAAAEVEVDQANLANAKRQFERMSDLWKNSAGRAMSRQDLDNARASMDSTLARVNADSAQLALLQQELKDAQLVAPATATVRSRLMEPGEMASPARAVLTLAVTDPKWVRVYVAEPDLGKLHPGAHAIVSVDSYPGRSFHGWIGYISSVAEFTPKNIETEELRTSLVYEVRVFVHDQDDVLRLGMPATIRVPLTANVAASNRA